MCKIDQTQESSGSEKFLKEWSLKEAQAKIVLKYKEYTESMKVGWKIGLKWSIFTCYWM